MEEKNENLKIIIICILAILILFLTLLGTVFTQIFLQHTDKKNFSTDIIFVRGLIEDAIGNRKSAINDFTTLINHKRHLVITYEYRGKAKIKEGLYNEAISDFNHALELKPDYIYIYKIRAQTKKLMKDNRGALNDSLTYRKKLLEVRLKKNNQVTFSKYQTKNEKRTIDFNPYMNDLQRTIRKNWHPPKADENKKVVMLFTIKKNGDLTKMKIIKSSGSSKADSAAILAVSKSLPLKPLPSAYPGKTINIEFTFDYNVHKKNISY